MHSVVLVLQYCFYLVIFSVDRRRRRRSFVLRNCFYLVIFSVDIRRRRRSFVLPIFEARRMSSTMIEDLEELDYMGEWEGRDVGGRE